MLSSSSLFPVTTLLKCLTSEISAKYLEDCNNKKIDPDPRKIQGMSGQEILSHFYNSIEYKKINLDGNSKRILSFLKVKF